ncbi:Homeobox protein homothorax, partial [Trachymyrmex septentrionalis]
RSFGDLIRSERRILKSRDFSRKRHRREDREFPRDTREYTRPPMYVTPFTLAPRHTLDGRGVQGDKRWFTASRTFEDGGYSVTWLTEVEVALPGKPRSRILALARLAFPARRGSIARTRTVRKVVCCQWLWRGELAGCNCIKLAVTRPCINHSCGSREGPRRYNARSARTRLYACTRMCTHRATYRLVWCPRKDRYHWRWFRTSLLRHSIHEMGKARKNERQALYRPPSSSLSYPGAGANDDARSPGSGGTPGPLSQQAPASLDSSDPGNWKKFGSNERTAPMVKTRPGSVSHRRVYKFTTSSHKDSLRSRRSLYSFCRANIIVPRSVPVRPGMHAHIPGQEHDNPQLALSPSDENSERARFENVRKDTFSASHVVRFFLHKQTDDDVLSEECGNAREKEKALDIPRFLTTIESVSVEEERGKVTMGTGNKGEKKGKR